MVAANTDVYKTLDEIPIYNFYKCVYGNLKYMYKGNEGELNNHLNEAWEDLYDAYCLVDKNSKRQRKYALIGEIKWLELRLQNAPILLNMLLKEDYDEKVIIILKNYKLNFYTQQDKESQIKKFLKVLENSKSKLKRKIRELDDMKDNEDPETKENDINKLYEQAIIIERNINVKPDIFKDSVNKWLAYWKIMEKQKTQNNV